MNNGAKGVLVEASVANSSISKTVALGNLDFDLQDDNANCDGNTWARSIFTSSDTGGMMGHSCIQ